MSLVRGTSTPPDIEDEMLQKVLGTRYYEMTKVFLTSETLLKIKVIFELSFRNLTSPHITLTLIFDKFIDILYDLFETQKVKNHLQMAKLFRVWKATLPQMVRSGVEMEPYIPIGDMLYLHREMNRLKMSEQEKDKFIQFFTNYYHDYSEPGR